MIDTLEPYNLILTELQSSIPQILRKIFDEHGKFIAQLVQEEQLSEGKDGDGNLLGTYSRVTEIISLFESPKPIKLKKEGEPFNFEWTGKWFRNMKARLKTESDYEIFSSDFKHKLLVETYGDAITKVNPKLNEYINEKILKPKLYQYFYEKLSIAA